MKISKTAFEKAVKKNLAVGKRVDSAEVRKTLQKIGIDTRFKGEVKESQLRTAFETLKEKGLLKERSRGAGEMVFKTEVKKEVSAQGVPIISKERQLAHAKALLRERLDEEAAKKMRIDEALSGKSNVTQKKSSVHQPMRSISSFGSVLGVREEKDGENKSALSSLGGGPSYGSSPLSSSPGKISTQEPPDMFGPEE